MRERTGADAGSLGQVGRLRASVTAARVLLARVAFESRNLHPLSLSSRSLTLNYREEVTLVTGMSYTSVMTNTLGRAVQ